MPLIYHRVDVTLIAVAIPLAARVRGPVEEVPTKRKVSTLMPMVNAPAPLPLIKVMHVPIS